MNKNLSISNILILLSIIATVLVYLDPKFFAFGMNRDFLDQGIYHIYILQFFTSNFIHGGVFHLCMNSLFIYYFGNQVELIMGHKKYLLFFILNAVFVGIGLTLFAGPHVNTIGISGFAMALMSYYTLYLKSMNNPEYKGGLTAIVVNLAIGLSPQISLLGHLFGAIFGAIYYYSLQLVGKK